MVIYYLETTPSQSVVEFQPLTEKSATISSIYKQELDELPNTRLWFGYQDKGFQVADNGNNILFSRNATRVYAASSNPLKPGKETTAAADSEAFLGWWNEHYEEVARYEPQYERLNEIIKWSLVISWLNESGKGDILDFLQSVPVKDDNWFPDWVQANKGQLKFPNWDSQPCNNKTETYSKKPVCFYAQGYKGTKTETLPLLQSKDFTQFGKKGNYIEGGVSLASKDIFHERIPLPKSPEINEVSLRSDIEYGSISADGNNLSFKTLEETTYSLKGINESQASNTIKAKEETKFRSPETQLANLELTKDVTLTDQGIEINTKADDVDLGNFSTTKTQKGFTVGWQSRDLDAGQSLAFKLSRSGENPDTFLISQPNVESVAKQDTTPPPSWYVKMTNSKSWIQLTPEVSGGGGGKKPPQWFAIVGSPQEPNRGGSSGPPSGGSGGGGGDKNYELDFLDEGNVKKIIDKNQAKCLKGNCKSSVNEPLSSFSDEPSQKKAQELIEDPWGASQKEQKSYQKSLNQVDDLLSNENYDRAAVSIAGLIKTHGQKPDLMVRQAVVKIKKGNLNAKQIIFDPQKSAWISQEGNFWHEIKGILGKNQINFKGLKFKKDNSLIYVQDTPGLNNIDWNQPIEATLPSISSKTRIYKLQAGKIGDVKLSDFGFDPNNSSFNVSHDYEIHNSSFRGHQNYLGNSSSDEKCRDQKGQNNQCDDNEPNVYIIFEN